MAVAQAAWGRIRSRRHGGRVPAGGALAVTALVVAAASLLAAPATRAIPFGADLNQPANAHPGRVGRYIRRNDAPLTSSTVPLAISAPGEAR
jgi:hypothetical protein